MGEQGEYDVVIIGAGAAGLSAAHHLSARGGLSLAILEARDRIGGRVHSVRLPGVSVHAELGAEFIHGWREETFEIVGAAGLAAYEMHSGTAWYSTPDSLEREGSESDAGDAVSGYTLPGDDDTDDMDTILRAIRGWDGADQPLRPFLEAHFPGARWAEGRTSVLRYISSFDAADPERVSVRWVGLTERASATPQGERQYHLLDAYASMTEWLRASLPPERTSLRLNTVVREVRWSPGRVEVAASTPEGTPLEPIIARAAVITLPLGVLLAEADAPGAVRFTPEPSGLRSALAGMAMGHAFHVTLRFRDAFWDAGQRATFQPQMPRLAFLFSGADAPIATWWTRYPVLAPLLIGWVGGPRAEKLLTLPDEAVAEAAITSFASTLHIPRTTVESLLVEWHLHNWGTDPYTRGVYSYVLAGSEDAPARLAEPIAGTLFFAGEATDTSGDTGTVQAALLTGKRAAGQALAALGGE